MAGRALISKLRTSVQPALLGASRTGICGSLLDVRSFAAQPAHADVEEQETLQPRPFLPGSRRCGVLAVKCGMTQEWDSWGVRLPLTVLWIDNCEVVQVKTQEKEGYNALQLGCGSKRDKQLNGRQLGHFKAADIGNKRKLAEFRVSPDGVLPVGTELTAAHFTPGQFVDIAGITSGKGFQGVMKRHGFAGQPASHGNSLAHRAAGGIGACQDPGKVWPGKKMPGRMGGVRRTVQSVLVYKVDPVRNLVYVKGQVPGHKGNFVEVRDAVMQQHVQPERPFPTYLGQALADIMLAPPGIKDPYEVVAS
eukprot:jgi/Astpho2/5210/Aster-04787